MVYSRDGRTQILHGVGESCVMFRLTEPAAENDPKPKGHLECTSMEDHASSEIDDEGYKETSEDAVPDIVEFSWSGVHESSNPGHPAKRTTVNE